MSAEFKKIMSNAPALTSAILIGALTASNAQAKANRAPVSSGGAGLEVVSGGTGFRTTPLTDAQIERRDINKLVRLLENPPRNMSNGDMSITGTRNGNTSYTEMTESAPSEFSRTGGVYYFRILKEKGKLVEFLAGEGSPVGKILEDGTIYTAEIGKDGSGLMDQQVYMPNQTIESELTLKPFDGLPEANPAEITSFFRGARHLVLNAMMHLRGNRVTGPTETKPMPLSTEQLPPGVTPSPF